LAHLRQSLSLSFPFWTIFAGKHAHGTSIAPFDSGSSGSNDLTPPIERVDGGKPLRYDLEQQVNDSR
jgi:hypothetical protein